MSVVKTMKSKIANNEGSLYSSLNKLLNYFDYFFQVSTYTKGFTLIIEPSDDKTPNVVNPVKFLYCVKNCKKWLLVNLERKPKLLYL